LTPEGLLPRHRRQIWIVVAVIITAVGCLVSGYSAHRVASDDATESRLLVDTSSAGIVSALRLDLEHQQDLVVSTSAYFVSFPQADQNAFRLWMSSLRAYQRYPDLVGVAGVSLVPLSQLATFEARALEDPAGALGPGGTFQISPPGNRPYYCFARVESTRPGEAEEPAGLDYCDTPIGPLLLKARDSGQGAYVPFGSGSSALFVVGTPIYSTGAVPTTLTARRADFLGWAGTELRPQVLLAQALRGAAHTAVNFVYRSGSTTATFSAGRAPRGSSSRTVNLHNGWRVQTIALVDGGSITANANALALLVIGALLSLLLGSLIFVLGTSRARALGLVKERTDELEHLALHDPLTGLPNRALILDRIHQMSARARRDRTEVALLFLDLDNFKDINDTLGHHTGDLLLVEVGARILRALREGDTVGRLGGDEFVILAEGASLSSGAEVLAQRILAVLEPHFEVAGCDAPLNVSASIGIAEGTRSDPEDLLRDADIAMYRAKGVGKQRAVRFLPSMQEAIADKRALSVDLRGALERDEFFILYQPIVDLESGAVTGVEALLRWRHPERGVIAPDLFIPELESSGAIVPVGAWVIQQACRQGTLWRAEGLELNVSINVSAKQLDDDGIIAVVERALVASGFDARLLTLELTETTLMVDVDNAVERLRRLKGLGVHVAIDDFGTGYSSLAYLRQFPIDVLKIDRSFVAGIIDSPEAATLVHTLVQLGKALGLGIIAEGVETDAQRSKLVTEEADAAQGYLFARPLSIEDFHHLMAERMDTAATPPGST
jgi:diguanylate cyclase (GGDEF)-like protein